MQAAYFDAATAAPMHPVARDALLAALEDGWADPDRLYAQARRARRLFEAARGTVADILGVRDDEVSFPTSGTDAAATAVLGGLAGRRRYGSTLVHSAIEHSAVLHTAARHVHTGGAAVEVPVDRLGSIDRAAWQDAVTAPGVALAALISASHEVATRQPVGWAAEVCAEAGVPLFVDAAMSLGWHGPAAGAPVPPGWSLLSGSARKWGGPAGVGVLVVRKGTRWANPAPVRGAINLPAVVAAAASLRAVHEAAAETSARLSALIGRIRETVARTVPDVEVVGDPDDRLPHLVTFSCLYVDGEALLHELDRRGFAVSSGSSCTASTLQPSHVLTAMGVLTHGNIRISLPAGAAESEVDRFLAELPGIVAALRAEVGM